MAGLKGGGSRARKAQRRLARTVAQIKANNAAAGYHFFEPATLRFFGSRIAKGAYPGARCTYFVTSEQRPRSDDPRRYSVRQACGGKINTIGDFQQYASLEDARAAAKARARRERT